VKHLDAQLQCSTPAGVSITATVPANTRATVRIPFPSGTNLAAITVSESGSPVWAAGAFVPGTPGVLSAAAGSADDTPVGSITLDVVVAGAGTFTFASE
jgi:hypothetical protein